MTEIQLPLHQNPQKGMNGKFLPKNTLEIRGGGVGNTNLTANELTKTNSAKKSSLKLLEKSSTNLTNIQVYPIKLNSNTEKLDPFGAIVSVNFIDVKSSTARNSTNINSIRNSKLIDNSFTEPNLNSQLQMISTNQNASGQNPLWNDESNSGWTSTGVMSDRSSVYSIDDGDFDREASRKVGNQLKAIESVLYEQTSTDSLYLNECKEWLEKFPHLRILGSQIQNYPKEDILDLSKMSTYRNNSLNRSISPFLNNNLNDASNNHLKRRENTDLNNQGLYLNGSSLPIHKLDEKYLNENRDEYEHLEEELFDEDGTYEELLAYDNQEEEYLFEHNKRLNINKRRKHGLPPITPKASMKDLVTSFLFDHMWSELIDWSIDLIKDYAKCVLDKELYYENSDDKTPIPENQATTPTPQNQTETDKANINPIHNPLLNSNHTKPAIVQLKLFDPPVNNNALLSLNNEKLSEKQSFTPGLSRDNSILYNQSNKLNNNYDGLLDSKFGYSESVSTVGELMPSNLKEILSIKQLNKNGLNPNKNLVPLMSYNRIGSGNRRQLQNYKKRYSSIEISSNPNIDNKNIVIHGAGLGKPNIDDKTKTNSLNPLNPINLNAIHLNRSTNNSTQAFHSQNLDDHNTSYDNDYLEYNFPSYHEHNENSVDEINVLSNGINTNTNNVNYNRNFYFNNYNQMKKNLDNHPQLPPIGSSLTLKPLRISSANNLKTTKERSERPLTSTAPRHDNIFSNKRSTTPLGGKGFNNFYPTNMRITGTRFNTEDTFYQNNNQVNSLSNFLSTKSFATMNQNNNQVQQGSNRRNSIKDNIQGLQRIHK